MADENIPAGGQTPPAANITPAPPGGQTPPEQRTTGGQTPPAPQVDEDDPLIRLSEARRMRKEAEENKALIKELQAFREHAERATLSEVEKAQRDATKHQQAATELQQKYQDLLVRTALKEQASGMGFQNPDDAILMIRATGELDYDAEGVPTNAEKLLKALADSKRLPMLAQQPPEPGQRSALGATNPGRSAIGAQPVQNPRNLSWNDVLKRPQ